MADCKFLFTKKQIAKFKFAKKQTQYNNNFIIFSKSRKQPWSIQILIPDKNLVNVFLTSKGADFICLMTSHLTRSDITYQFSHALSRFQLANDSQLEPAQFRRRYLVNVFLTSKGANMTSSVSSLAISPEAISHINLLMH